MEFIGRTKELSDLKQEYNNKHSFVVIYGRRRIGKTALIQEFIKDKPALYFLATEESEPQSMKRFALSLSQFANQEFIAKANFDDWIELFKLFAAVPGKNTKVLVLDEFQYMLNTNPAFTSIFQKAWDEILSKQDIMVIICSSYINMMAKQVVAENSPLYGRRTSLNKNGFLYEEPTFLLNKEVKEPVNYYSVMKAIAQNNHKLSEIASAMSTEGNKLSPYLETLQGLYLLEKRVPVTEKNPEKSRKGLYFIRDIFIRFWFMFVFPYKGELELDNLNFVQDKLKSNFIDNHVAFIYEEICRNIFAELCKCKEIDFVPSRIGAYWNKNEEIALVAIDESHKRIFAAECKYYKDDKPVDVNVYAKLVEKCQVDDFKGYDLTYGIFSKSGFTKHLRDIAKENKKLILIDECDMVK